MFKHLLICSVLFFSLQAYAKKNQKQQRKPSQTSDAFESLSIQYKAHKGKKSPLKDVKLVITPFVNSLSFQLAGKSIFMDCYVSSDYTKWNCLSACEGGNLEVSFKKNTRFDVIQLAPFQIKARTCDGSESSNDRTVTSKKPLTFVIEKVGLD